MAEKLSLLNDSSEESEVEFTINKNYADRYDNWRKLEEMQKLKDLSKDLSESSSSDDEEEPVIEKDFFRTLSLLKAKDPRMYDENYTFFKGESSIKKTKAKKDKPLFMKDYERQLVLKHNGELSDDDEESAPVKQTCKEEEEELKKSFKEALEDSNGDDDEDDGAGSLLQVRSKSKAEEEKEEADYKQWLETDEDMKHLNKVWNDPKLDDNEKFLRDYFLKEWYLEKNVDKIPTYEEITGDITTLSEDEKVLEEQEQFEHKYNFRYEEPDEEFIKRYPRITEDSLRRADNRRKQKREEIAERKKRDKEQKQEELKRLKALKRKEIEEKFLKLKEITGKEELNFDESDIESDFDPEKHDKKMGELFDDSYYTVEEIQKPEFEHDEELDAEKWDHWSREQDNDSKSDPNIDLNSKETCQEEVEEGNAKSQFEQEMIESTASRKRKGRKKSLFAKIVSEPKPLYDPDGKSFEDYLDEYYKLDYEDVIGDQPVRFKYRKVIPNDFGLSVDEILVANDKELNRWCSIKKTHQYRHDEEELYDVQAFQKKAQNLEVKKKVLASVYTQPKEDTEKIDGDGLINQESKSKKKRLKKKKKKGLNAGVNGEDNQAGSAPLENVKRNSTSLAMKEDQGLNVKKKNKLSGLDGLQSSAFLNPLSYGGSACDEKVSNSNSALQKSEEHVSKKSRRWKKKKLASLHNESIGAIDDLHNFTKPEIENINNLVEFYKNAKQVPLDTKMSASDNIKGSQEVEIPKESISNNAKRLNTQVSHGNKKSEEGGHNKKLKKNSQLDSNGDNSVSLANTLEQDIVHSPLLSAESQPVEKHRKKKKKIIVSSDVDSTTNPDSIFNASEQSLIELLDFPKQSEDESVPQSVKKKKRSKRHSSTVDTCESGNKFQKINAGPFCSSEEKSFPSRGSGHSKTNEKLKVKESTTKKQNKRKGKHDQDLFKKKRKKSHNDKSEVQVGLSTDKRLAVSNERLAAFGINPKKFKNSIIYSKR